MVPTGDEPADWAAIEQALARAVAYRRSQHRVGPRYSRLTDEYLEEQMHAVPGRTVRWPGGAGWHTVGTLYDCIRHEEDSVWLEPAIGSVRIQRAARRASNAPPSTPHAGIFFHTGLKR
jgi:hypothetical protein